MVVEGSLLHGASYFERARACNTGNKVYHFLAILPLSHSHQGYGRGITVRGLLFLKDTCLR